jgi:hypothetical protein
MSSAAFRNMVSSTTQTKNLDNILVGNASNYLPEGTHDVRITAVGPATTKDGEVIDGVVRITYEGEGGKTYNDNLYLTSQDGSEYSYGLRMLWSALIPDKNLLSKFFDLAATDDKAFEIFTGMACRVTLGPGKGFQVRATGDGKFTAVELDNKGAVVERIGDETYDSIDEAKNAATGRGFKRAYLKIRGMECSAKEANATAFEAALAAKAKAKPKITKAV